MSQERAQPEPSLTGCDRVKAYDWDTRTAWAVCMGESGGNARAANRTDYHKDRLGRVICVGSFGLMQIACIHGGEIYDEEANMAKAYEVYTARAKWDSSGWNAWGAFTDGRYLKFIK